MSTRLSILILNYNTKDIIIRCLDSIIALYKEKLESGEMEILVGDNGSTDGSTKEIKNHPPAGGSKIKNNTGLQIIENKENLGFAKGQNTLAQKAKGKFLFFLNSDTQIKNQNLLEMTKFLEENRKIGILGAKMIDENGIEQRSAGNFFSLFNIFLTLFLKEGFGRVRFSLNQTEKVDWVSGGAMMVKSELFKTLNGFNEKFFMYLEDMEFCYRAKKIDFSTYFYPGQLIVHAEHGSSNRAYAILNIYKGIKIFYKEHKTHWDYLIVKSFLEIKAILAVLIGLILNNTYLKTTYLKALKNQV